MVRRRLIDRAQQIELVNDLTLAKIEPGGILRREAIVAGPPA